MLLNAVFYVVLTGVVTMTFLSAGLAMTRSAAHRAAQPYLAAGYLRALDALQATIANQLRTGQGPNPLPAITPIPAACVDSGNSCRYTAAETIDLSSPGSVVQTACDPSQSNCASNVQTNGYVNEGRIAARITVTVAGADGTMLAARTMQVILRTLSVPPYVIVAGSRDATFDDVVSGHAAGDDGGIATATPDPCDTQTPAGTSSDTVVRVAYHNIATGQCSSGSGYGSVPYASATSVPGWTP